MARWDRRTRLTSILSMRDDTKKGLASATRGFQGYLSGMGREAGQASQALSGALMGNATWAASAIGGVFLGMAGKAITQFADMEYQAAQLFTLMRDESERTRSKVLGDLDAISRKLGQPMELTLTTAYQLGSGGVAARDIPGMTELVGRGAAAGLARGQEGQVGKLLVTTMSAFDKEASEAERTMDSLLQTVAKGQTTLGEMTPVMGRLNGAFAQMGVNLDETSSSLSFMTTKTGNTSESVTGLVAMVNELGRAEGKAGKFFKETAGVTFPEYIAATDDLAGAMAILGDAAASEGKNMIDVFGSAEAARAAAELSTLEYRVFYKDFTRDIVGTTQEMWEEYEGTTRHAMDKAGSTWSSFWRGLGSEFVSIWRDITLQGEGEYQRRHRLEREAQEQHQKNILNALQEYHDLRVEAERTAARRELSVIASAYIQRSRMEVAWMRRQRLNALIAGDPLIGGGAGFHFSLDDPATAYWNNMLRLQLGLDDEEVTTGGGGGGGGRATTALESIALTNRELVALMQSGQALTVRLDANIDEGVILRADTVQRATGQVAARMGNQLVNRVRSG